MKRGGVVVESEKRKKQNERRKCGQKGKDEAKNVKKKKNKAKRVEE